MEYQTSKYLVKGTSSKGDYICMTLYMKSINGDECSVMIFVEHIRFGELVNGVVE